MAKVWELDLSPGASTWLQGMPTTDGFFQLPGDAPDPNYPFAYQNEGCKYAASVGPAGVPGITGDPLYGFLGFSWHNIAWIEWLFGDGSIGGPDDEDGFYWNSYRGRWRAIHYVDSSVDEGVVQYTVAVLCSGELANEDFRVTLESDDSSGNNWYLQIEGIPGPDIDSDTFSFSDLEGKYVEFDVRWRASSDGGSAADGYITVRMRTSTDLTTWTDYVVMIDHQNSTWTGWWDDDPQVHLGVSMPLGFYGFPGAVVLAEIYDVDEGGETPPFEPNTDDVPQDHSTPCCGQDTPTGSSTSPASGDPTRPLPPWTTQCAGGGTVPSEPDPSAAEAWA